MLGFTKVVRVVVLLVFIYGGFVCLPLSAARSPKHLVLVMILNPYSYDQSDTYSHTAGEELHYQQGQPEEKSFGPTQWSSALEY